jgi:putative salt-induced outer membrane protein
MGDKSESYSKARLYAETSHQFNKSVSAKLWMEYIPNFDEGEDYLLNIEPSLTTVLTSILSFKTSYTWNYDNLPSTGKAKADYTLKVSLVAKF